MWGIDTYGSVFKKYKETGIFDKNEIYPYITEGIGEDFLPQNVDFSRHRPLREGDRQGRRHHDHAASHARRASSPATRPGRRWPDCCSWPIDFKAGEIVVVIFHDHGTRYLGKMFNDDWMREKGFLEPTGLTARDLVADQEGAALVAIDCGPTRSPSAAHLMTEHGLLADSRDADGRIVGSINEARLYAEIVKNPEVKRGPVEAIMQPAFPFADISTSLEALATMMTPENPAVLVRDFKSDETYIITRSDVIKALS